MMYDILHGAGSVGDTAQRGVVYRPRKLAVRFVVLSKFEETPLGPMVRSAV